jgi:hypothetical protein
MTRIERRISWSRCSLHQGLLLHHNHAMSWLIIFSHIEVDFALRIF